MRPIILTGAGASFGSTADLKHQPPLGPKLYDTLRERYSRWRNLPLDIDEAFRRDNNFEEGMRVLRLSGCRTMAPQLMRDMAKLFLSYDVADDSLYLSMMNMIKSQQSNAIIATMNYDLLLEIASEMVFNCSNYLPFKKQIAKPCPLIMKLHGSPNWIPHAAQMINCELDAAEALIKAPIDIKTIVDAQYSYEMADIENDEAISPAMSLYAAGKDVLFCPEQIGFYQKKYAAFCRVAPRIYIVGAKVSADPHIWDPVVRSKANLRYYNISANDCAEFEQRCAGRTRAFSAIQGDFSTFLRDVQKTGF